MPKIQSGIPGARRVSTVGDMTIAELATALGLDPYKVRAETNAGQAIGTAAQTVVVFEDEIEDADSVYDNATGVYTAPVAGDYLVAAMVSFAAITTWAATDVIQIRAIVDGTTGYVLDRKTDQSTASHAVTLSGSRSVPVTAGQTIAIEVFQNSGDSLSLDTSALINWLEIRKEPG